MSTTEWRWLSRFRQQFELCGLDSSETCVVRSESASRPSLVDTAVLAAQSLGADVFQVVMPTPANPGPVALRSTGTSLALHSNSAALAARARSTHALPAELHRQAKTRPRLHAWR